MESKKEKSGVFAEIEAGHAGYPGSQDNYYGGNIKVIGRILSADFYDPYSRVAFPKLYQTKHAKTSADVLNNWVLLFCEEH